VLPVYGEAPHLQRNGYQIKIPYRDDADLDKILDELLYEIWLEADRGNCFSESEASLEGTDRGLVSPKCKLMGESRSATALLRVLRFMVYLQPQIRDRLCRDSGVLTVGEDHHAKAEYGI